MASKRTREFPQVVTDQAKLAERLRALAARLPNVADCEPIEAELLGLAAALLKRSQAVAASSDAN